MLTRCSLLRVCRTPGPRGPACRARLISTIWRRKSGRTPLQLLDEAAARGLDAHPVKADPIVAWLRDTYGVGRGHAMALVHIIKNGPVIDATHVGTTGTHRDEDDTLRLDRIASR